MNNKGVTLTELLIVIVVMGIIAAFSVVFVGSVIEDTKIKADEHNVEVIEDVILRASFDGVLIIKNGKLYNTVTERGYSGTASWFYEDLVGYLDIQVRPQASIALNDNNKTGEGLYKFWFLINGDEINIFYYDENRVKIILNTFTFV